MPCFNPVAVYKADGGGIAFRSGRHITRRERVDTVTGEVTIEAREVVGFNDRPMQVRCGHCVGCRGIQSSAWALRSMHEAQMHERNSFITLTYADAPYSLDVRDWQLFAKRFRKKLGPFRFLHCGEYGEKNGRAHLHALIFGHDFKDGRTFLRYSPHPLWRSPVLEELWPHGHSSVGDLTIKSAQYVARYVVKKMREQDYGDRRPPYVTMSRNPGLGQRWFDKYRDEVFPSDECNIGGVTYTPPRFYTDQLPDDEKAAIKKRRADKSAKHADDNTWKRLKVRERVALARIGAREL